MKTDRMTKILLALIALALFMNALNPWLLTESVFAAQAPPANLPMMEVHLRNIDAYLQRMDPNRLGSSLNNIERGVGRMEAVACRVSDDC